MRLLLRYAIILFPYLQTYGQLKDEKVAGEYYLEGVTEVASGFQILNDHTFNFFFSYGAVDRQGKGTWKLEGNDIIFNSEQWPGTDFKLEKQETRCCMEKNEIAIQITDKNQAILGYIGCQISGDGKILDLKTEQDGSVIFQLQQVDTITLYHKFFSDDISVFPLQKNNANFFEFTIQPWLGTIYFKDFTLSVTKEGLTGGHPLKQDGTQYTYSKNR